MRPLPTRPPCCDKACSLLPQMPAAVMTIWLRCKVYESTSSPAAWSRLRQGFQLGCLDAPKTPTGFLRALYVFGKPRDTNSGEFVWRGIYTQHRTLLQQKQSTDKSLLDILELPDNKTPHLAAKLRSLKANDQRWPTSHPCRLTHCSSRHASRTTGNHRPCLSSGSGLFDCRQVVSCFQKLVLTVLDNS